MRPLRNDDGLATNRNSAKGWVSNLSTAQWLASLVVPAGSMVAAMKILANVPIDLAIIYGTLLGLAVFFVWQVAAYMRQNRQKDKGAGGADTQQGGAKISIGEARDVHLTNNRNQGARPFFDAKKTRDFKADGNDLGD